MAPRSSPAPPARRSGALVGTLRRYAPGRPPGTWAAGTALRRRRRRSTAMAAACARDMTPGATFLRMRRGSETSLPAERHDPRPGRDPRLELHDAHAGGQPEPRGACPTRIQHGHRPVHELEQRPGRMPVTDDLVPGKGGVDLLGRGVSELIPVGHDDLEPVELECPHLRPARAPLEPG